MEANPTVAIICIDSEQSRNKHSGWGKYSILAWEKYCEKYNLSLQVIDKLDGDIHHPKWMKFRVFDSCPKADGPILLVDGDTMPSFKAPNIFQIYTKDLGVVEDNYNLHWLNNSLTEYKKAFFNSDFKFDYSEYFNSGVMLLRQKHKPFLHRVENFYKTHKDKLAAWNKPNTGVDQTILNLLAKESWINLEFMSPSWNQHSMVTLDLFKYNFQTNDPTPYFIKTGNIWHFTGLPVEQREPLMKNVWDATQFKY